MDYFEIIDRWCIFIRKTYIMKKTIRLTERDLTRLVKKVINEQMDYKSLRPCKPGEKGTLVQQSNIFALSSGSPFCKVVISQSTTPSPTTNSGKKTIPNSRMIPTK